MSKQYVDSSPVNTVSVSENGVCAQRPDFDSLWMTTPSRPGFTADPTIPNVVVCRIKAK